MNVSHDRSIITALQKMTGTFNVDTVFLVTANVTKVDEAKGICSVETISGIASIELTNVELQTVISDGLLFIPKIGSEVKVIYSKYTTPFIVQYSEVEKMYFAADLMQFDTTMGIFNIDLLNIKSQLINIIGATTFTMPVSFGAGFSSSAPPVGGAPSTLIGEMIFNGGANGGMVKVNELTTKLNNLENLVNSIVTIFNTHTHTAISLGSPTSPSLIPVVGGLTPTISTEIEDPLITH